MEPFNYYDNDLNYAEEDVRHYPYGGWHSGHHGQFGHHHGHHFGHHHHGQHHGHHFGHHHHGHHGFYGQYPYFNWGFGYPYYGGPFGTWGGFGQRFGGGFPY